MVAIVNTVEILIGRSLLEIINERDSERRWQAIADIYTSDITFYALDQVVEGPLAVHGWVPRWLDEEPDCVFSLAGSISVNHNLGRLMWRFGPVNAPPVACGTHIALSEDDRIYALYTLMESNRD